MAAVELPIDRPQHEPHRDRRLAPVRGELEPVGREEERHGRYRSPNRAHQAAAGEPRGKPDGHREREERSGPRHDDPERRRQPSVDILESGDEGGEDHGQRLS
ncbi:MAG TPA: hypothetical protein VI122_22365 [Thermoleophilaceae bacterium]